MSRKPPDFDLWTETARTVHPLRKQKQPKHGARKQGRGVPLAALPRAAPRAEPVLSPRPQSAAPPPLTGFDRRTTQKMTRGNVEIERRIDLHGSGAEMARVHLLGFLRQAYRDGARVALVITGKGASPFTRHTLHGAQHFHAPERQGMLRRLLPEWLNEAEFRSLVSGFQPAHPRHGGGGAFYVKIRRIR